MEGNFITSPLLENSLSDASPVITEKNSLSPSKRKEPIQSISRDFIAPGTWLIPVVSSGIARLWHGSIHDRLQHQWTGGNLPDFEDTTSYWEKSQSGFGLLAMVLVIFVLAMVIGPLAVQIGAAGGVAGPATALINGISGAVGASAGVGGVAFTAVGAAATEAAFAGAVSALAGANLSGAVNGPYRGASSGYSVAVRPDTPAGLSVYDGLKDAFDTPTIEGSTQGAYGVACAPGAPTSACGGSSGVVPRSDGGTQTATTEFWRDNGKPLVEGSPFTQ